MKIILIGGPGHGERYEDIAEDQEVVTLDHAEVPVRGNHKIRKVDVAEYRRSTTPFREGDPTVVFVHHRDLPGKIVNFPGPRIIRPGSETS